MSLGKLMKAPSFKSLVIKINLLFFIFCLVLYISLLIQPQSLYNDVRNSNPSARCSLHDCITKKMVRKQSVAYEEMPTILQSLQGKLGLINTNSINVNWSSLGQPIAVEFEKVSSNFEWKDLFPEWIDEEEENEGPTCPEIPMPDFSSYGEVDVVVAEVPCRRNETNEWARDVFRLQVHLMVAGMGARKGRRDGNGKVKMALKSECRPMMELFRCDDVVQKEGKWWLFEVEGHRLEDKVNLPVGSCQLALPLWQPGTNKEYDTSNLQSRPSDREAYATVLHSSSTYVCGAIALAQSLKKTNTTRDLILLHDASIPPPKLQALALSGWTLHQITRIRNPYATKNSYNEYNYSKLRLFQLTRYRKLIFIDADIIVLRNLDLLFSFPHLSAVGNDGVIFNSGVMVLEPSNCTFKILMKRRKEIVSYNGGDQGFLNEVFVWWHRLPRRVNFLKNFWTNGTSERVRKDALFGSDPPKLYGIHYLGLKPWLCYREYDCNWNVEGLKIYASDAAHWRWWTLHDGMEERLKGFCGLEESRKEELEMDRISAERLNSSDGHWKIKVQ